MREVITHHDHSIKEQIKRREPIVAVYTGPRGSGKSVSVVAEMARYMVNGENVWSNIPIEFEYEDIDGSITRYESMPLDMNALYTFEKSLVLGTIFIDEIQLWASSANSRAVAARLMADSLTMIRHRGLNFFFTIQNYQRLTGAFKDQVDMWVSCFDLYFRYRRDLTKGTVIAQRYHDMSGMFTGHAYGEAQQYDTFPMIFHAKAFWDIYDSYADYNPLEAGRGLAIDRDKNILSYDSQGNAHVHPAGFKDFMRQTAESTVSAVVDSLRFTGEKFIYSTDLESTLRAAGCDIPLRQLGKVLPQYGLLYKKGNAAGNGGYEVLPEKNA